jgi:carbamoyl-phosphate synthase large subunit
MNVIEVERPLGVIVQLGGQTPLKLARALSEAGVPLLGTSFENIDRAENRRKFGELVDSLGLLQPASATATSAEEAVTAAERLGWPVLVRPSYVLGGRGMRVVYGAGELSPCWRRASPSRTRRRCSWTSSSRTRSRSTSTRSATARTTSSPR